MRPINPQLKDECERLLSEVLQRGDKGRLAEKLGVSLSEISQQANPEEIRTSDFYRFVEFIESLKAINGEAARTLVADIQARVDHIHQPVDLTEITGRLAKEHADVIQAQLHNKPLHVRQKEWLDVRMTADLGLAALRVTARKGNEIAQPRQKQRLRRVG